MAVWIGRRHREITAQARRAGYVAEIEPVWAHQCEPPRSDLFGVPSHPILHDGNTAEVGTIWRCACGAEWVVECPDQLHPGYRAWERVPAVVARAADTQDGEPDE